MEISEVSNMEFDPTRAGVELPDDALLKKFDVPAPRYTSYPTADRFHGRITPEDYQAALAGREKAAKPAKLSLYCHIPFCHDVCYYCGCNKIVTRDHSRPRTSKRSSRKPIWPSRSSRV